jgi:4-carboxymuconolactone decarboxylase
VSAMARHDPAASLAATDPELAAVLEGFRAEVSSDGSPDPRTRFVVLLGALIACQALSEYRRTLAAALDAGVTPVEAKEVVYQAVPYVGIAKVADFLDATNEVLVARGVELPLPGQSTTTPETRMAKGYAVQAEIIGRERIEGLYANAPADEMHIQRYLSANCFGDTYTRTGLDLPLRELLTLSILAAHGGCDPQVRGHVAANLNVGNGRTMMIEVVTQLLPFVGYPRTLNALAAVDAVAPPPEKKEAGNA